ncbi:MAG TPA: hypothetical protein VKB31_01685, partial [Trueperaceae bacterium]|nr:hypothetical protein [Trueperaceae bacterium]
MVLGLAADAQPVALAVAPGALPALPVGVGVAPSLFGLGRVRRRIEVAEHLQHVLRVQVDAHLSRLHGLVERAQHRVDAVAARLEQ